MSEADWYDSAYYWLKSISPYLTEDKFSADVQEKIDNLMNTELQRITKSFSDNDHVRELISEVDINNVNGKLMLGAIDVVNLLNSGDRKKAAEKKLEILDEYESVVGRRPFSSDLG